MISKLKEERDSIERQAMKINLELEKVSELHKNAKLDLDDATDRLHQVNRVRHELDLRL